MDLLGRGAGVRRALLTAGGKANPLAGVNIGDSFMGGYYAGIIDTTKGNIIAADSYQTGKRYALIVSPKSLEVASPTPTTGASYPVQTRWDGLSATAAMNSSSYPAAHYCAGLSHPSDGASAWYLAAMDELELLYRNLKCSTESNYTTALTGATFPSGTQNMGYNPSSDPAGATYQTTNPTQTAAALFQSGGTQALGVSGSSWQYMTSSYFSSGNIWIQYVSGAATAGRQQSGSVSTSGYETRPVRRLAL